MSIPLRLGPWRSVTDKHIAAMFELSTIADFTNIIFATGVIPATTTFDIPDIVGVEPGKEYFVRAKWQGELGGWSEWSSPIFFTIAAQELTHVVYDTPGTYNYIVPSAVTAVKVIIKPGNPTTSFGTYFSTVYVNDDFEYIGDDIAVQAFGNIDDYSLLNIENISPDTVVGVTTTITVSPNSTIPITVHEGGVVVVIPVTDMYTLFDTPGEHRLTLPTLFSPMVDIIVISDEGTSSFSNKLSLMVEDGEYIVEGGEILHSDNGYGLGRFGYISKGPYGSVSKKAAIKYNVRLHGDEEYVVHVGEGNSAVFIHYKV